MATLLLSGIAVNALNVAFTSFMLTTSRESTMRQILFWLMGGLEATNWDHVRLSAPIVLIGSALLMLFARELDILLWGEQRALSLGGSWLTWWRVRWCGQRRYGSASLPPSWACRFSCISCA
jgi:iron complex transport system permease protein